MVTTRVQAGHRGVLAALAALLAFAALANGQAALAATVPDGFTESLVATGITRPMAMEFAPDGRLFVTQQGGKVRVIKNGVLQSEPFVTVTTDPRGERGLSGIAFDPNFETSPYVYLYYTATTPTLHNRVSRFLAAGDVAVAGSEEILMELDDLGTSEIHMGGSLGFGRDGKLYVTTGENGMPATSQSLTSTMGKVLRINPNGSIPADNPFYGSLSGKYRAIWALGLRNPFTSAFQPGTGRYFINDVGGKNWEEIDEGVAGANYGWPETEGPTSDPRFRAPFFAYGHAIGDTTGCAIAGGTFYNPPTGQFPQEYTGTYFFADLCSGWIRRIDPGNASDVRGFATDVVRPVDLKVADDGTLYYLSRPDASPGEVYRIEYSGKPAISSHPASQTIAPGESATFSVVASGQEPFSYQWQRDGIDIPGATSSTYTAANASLSDDGAQFRCVVTNAIGSATSQSGTLTVTTNARPTATIGGPAAGSLYSAGQTIAYAGSGTDAEDGALPASAYTWEVAFHHNTHTHPFIPPTNGATGGSFTIPSSGETDHDVWYRIYLTVEDSGGLTDLTYVDVMPRKATITLGTTPEGLVLKLDDQPKTAYPYSTLSVVGMARTLEAVSPQTVNGVTYEFVSWNDDGAAKHTITTPATDTAYTAVFRALNDTTAPSVALTAPLQGATVVGTTTLAADASDASGITGVKWYVDGVQVGYDGDGEPWTKAWNSATVANGSHTMFAKARDAAGNWGTSRKITLTVSNPPPGEDTIAPTVSVTAPTAAAVVSGSVTLSASASDASGITSVKWYVDGAQVAYDPDGEPWTKSWNSTSVANGQHKMYAKARDAAGNWGTSKSITVTVAN